MLLASSAGGAVALIFWVAIIAGIIWLRIKWNKRKQGVVKSRPELNQQFANASFDAPKKAQPTGQAPSAGNPFADGSSPAPAQPKTSPPPSSTPPSDNPFLKG
jgi:hypothetical protein